MQPLLKSWKRKFSPSAFRAAAPGLSPAALEEHDLPPAPGTRVERDGTYFAVYSRNATAIDLCLYDPNDPSRETARVCMQRAENDIWHAKVTNAGPGTLYGFRAHGPWLPVHTMRFNANKLLLDPYARAIHGKPDAVNDMRTVPDPKHPPGSIDNGATALKSVVIDESFDWGGVVSPRIPWRETVICELHVKGFTQTHPRVPAHLRGTYAGLGHPAVTNYLRDLGVTTVQLLPVHQHLDDSFLLEKGLTNYWGYNTIGFFAPHNTYASVCDPQAQVREFKAMVKALHAAGIEVILDVVYNHTAEGDERGPMLMFRGLDDYGYYRHHYGADGASYINVTGCGNSVDSAAVCGLRLIMDSLRYWVTEMHVDGFRFDLAVTVTRNEMHAFHAQSQFLSAVTQDPVLSRVKLIAEPWDISRMDSYQVGQFPKPWRELNGKYRDTVRSWWHGDSGTTAEFSKRLCGSQDLYSWNQRTPQTSINFITSHDGFTLLDLVSYKHKHNEANGEENRDGDSQNHSSNFGVEGPTTDPKVNALRSRVRRGMIATMFCSLGVPFLTAGDERGRTQDGNNNAYCHDNATSWIDWSSCDEEMLEFTRRMAAIRRSHPILRRAAFFDGNPNHATGLPDVSWLEGNGTLLCHEEWHSPSRRHFGALLGEDEGPSKPLLLLFNSGTHAIPFLLPGTVEARWQVAFDTALSPSFPSGEAAEFVGTHTYPLQTRSIACLTLIAGSCAEIEPKMC